MATHDIVVIGASAGGVEALSRVAAGLPRDIRAAIFVVLHLSRGRSMLPEILTRVGQLPAAHPTDRETLQYGRIYVAPPDHHMVIQHDTVRVVHGPSENGVRPAADPLFRSAARTYGPRVVGVVLTGALDDGTAGLAAVKEAGGVTVVQDPDEAFAPSMPRSAMDFVAVDHVLPLSEVPVLISMLARESATGSMMVPAPHLEQLEPDLGSVPLAVRPTDRPGHVSIFTCRDCHGALWEADEGDILRFRCRVGHVYTAESMVAAHTDSVDRALWAALRALEERAALTRKLADRARQRNKEWVARAFGSRAEAAEEQAAIVKQVLLERATTRVVPDHASQEGGDTAEIAPGSKPPKSD